jgi:hypothetical protein
VAAVAQDERARRFARLAPRTGDLFEHFGVPETAPPAEPLPAGEPAVRAATACARCGWYRLVPLAEPCWLCGAAP